MNKEMLRTVQFASDFVDRIATRDAAGSRLRIDWGEPDEHGYWTPTVHTDETDNIVAAERRATVERIREAITHHSGWDSWLIEVDRVEFLAILDAEAAR